MRAGVIPACIMKEWELPAGIIETAWRFKDLLHKGLHRNSLCGDSGGALLARGSTKNRLKKILVGPFCKPFHQDFIEKNSWWRSGRDMFH